MCMIIVKPQGVHLPSEQVLRTIAEYNCHGFGFITSSDKVFKTLNKEVFLAKLNLIPDEEVALIHFRLATYGSRKTNNCHPFQYRDVWMAHNGSMPLMSSRSDRTDSQEFLGSCVGYYLDKLGKKISDPVFARYLNALDEVVGSSRLAFMYDHKCYYYGTWYRYKGCFYSNAYHLPRAVPVTIGNSVALGVKPIYIPA